MSDGQKSLWVGAALVVVIALAGATLWKVANPSNDVSQQLTALNSRIETANAALQKMQTASADTGIKSQIAQLDAKIAKINATLAALPKGAELKGVVDQIEKTNAALADLQKGRQIKSISDKLDALNAGLKSADAALARISKAGAQADLGSKIDAIGTDLKSVDGSLAAIKQAVPGQNLTAQLAAMGDQIKSLAAHVAALQQAGTGTDQSAALAGAVAALKKDVDAASALSAKLTDQLGKLQEATETAAAPKPSELIFVYLHLPNENQLPKTTRTVSPLTVEFKRIGSTSDAGQAQAIIDKLKEIIKGRKDCSISVVGYADTLGSDNVNLAISKKRASVIAKQLAAAFAGTGVQINQAAWGERRLKDWTPDQTPNLANRRVDISVNCKG